MARMFGYAPAGMRCFGTHNSMSKWQTNVIGALTRDRLIQTILPVLPNGAVVVMDNTSFHPPEKAQKFIESVGYLLEYFPSYSPVLNPIKPYIGVSDSPQKKFRLFC